MEQESLEKSSHDSSALSSSGLSANNLPPQFNTSLDYKSTLDYKKHRHKAPSEECLEEAPRTARSPNWSEPHGDESSARDDLYSLSPSSLSPVEEGDNAYSSYLDEDFLDHEKQGLGFVHNLEDSPSGHNYGDFNFPKLDHGECDTFTREGGPTYSPKTRKVVNPVVNQIKSEHRRFNVIPQSSNSSHNSNTTSRSSNKTPQPSINTHSGELHNVGQTLSSSSHETDQLETSYETRGSTDTGTHGENDNSWNHDGTSGDRRTDLYVVNKLFPIRETTEEIIKQTERIKDTYVEGKV